MNVKVEQAIGAYRSYLRAKRNVDRAEARLVDLVSGLSKAEFSEYVNATMTIDPMIEDNT